ncbi:Oaf3p PWA37_004447 [Arxiozyma heterogenica]|uniref:Oaf3p n=1 Tax=Arxiozyma heterogenica TaxID=278026 RepID=UPI002EE1F390
MRKVDKPDNVKRRNRLTIVCTNCKRRKIRCDKKHPCDACIKANRADECKYISIIKEDTKRKNTLKLGNDYKKHKGNQTVADKDGNLAHIDNSEFINIIPNGFYVDVKRSAINMFAQFVDLSIEHRDVYLKLMTRFRSIVIKNMSEKYENEAKSEKHKFNPYLPKSFKPLSVFDFHEQTGNRMVSQKGIINYEQHKILFDKFAKMRKNEQLKFLSDESIKIKDYLIDKELFLSQILQFFTEKILPLIPIFDMNILTKEIIAFFDYMSTNDNISTKSSDHIVMSIIFLIILLTKLSISNSKYPHVESIYESILKIDTSKYLAIIHHYLFQMKILRKCTLLQLQCLILLKFYQWCSPDDGDGSDGQHNQIFLGMIISSAKELGINWHCINNERYCFSIANGARPSLMDMGSKDYLEHYRRIWSVIVSWDRKMSLAFGQECLIGKSYIGFLKESLSNIIENNNNSNSNSNDITDKSQDISHNINFQHKIWHARMLSIDHYLLKINNMIHNAPTRVNVALLEDLISQIKNELKRLRLYSITLTETTTGSNGNKYAKGYNTQDYYDTINESAIKVLDTEFDWCLNLLELSIYHGRMVYYERTTDYVKYHTSIQELWDYLILLAKKCHCYFFPEVGQDRINGFMRFYCNRIVEIATNKLCVLIPTFILRLNRFPQMTNDDRDLMCKFLYQISSVYFNEYAFEHFKCFKKMFTAKITYKMLNRPHGKDIWKNILQFLIYKISEQDEILNSVEDIPNITCSSLRELIPYFNEYYQEVKSKGYDYTNVDYLERIWNNKVIPVSACDNLFKLNLHEEKLDFIIKEDRYEHQLNIFASFYDNSSTELVVRTYGETLVSQKQDSNVNKTAYPGNVASNNFTEFPVMPIVSVDIDQSLGTEASVTRTVSSNNGTFDFDLDRLTQPIETISSLEFLNDLFEPTDFISFFK